MMERGGFKHQTAPSAIIALGANLPFRALRGPALLENALSALRERGLAVRRASGPWASPAWPPSDQPDFVNAVAEIDAGARGATEVFAILLEVERQFGRERRARWAARTLDLDLIDMSGAVLAADGLILPHPRAHERPFVLAPLAEMAPDWRHPILGSSAAALLSALPPEKGAAQRLPGPELGGLRNRA